MYPPFIGISPTTTLPFSPPLAFRLTPRKQNHKNEKAEILEGLCHKCHDWAPVEGVKCVEAKVSTSRKRLEVFARF